MSEYWNHNTAYHRELIAAVPRAGGAVLDVGCGDGLLVERLASRAGRVLGIDTDASALDRARLRLAHTPNAAVVRGSVLDAPVLDGERFDLITCVATLHHLPLVPALERMRDLLAPGGRLRVVGLAANRGALDWIVAGLVLVPVRVIGRLRGETSYPGMTIASPGESLAEIRAAAGAVLPGSRIRRRFYYRYTLEWTAPRPAPRETA